jgi:hypothetical protein
VSQFHCHSLMSKCHILGHHTAVLVGDLLLMRINGGPLRALLLGSFIVVTFSTTISISGQYSFVKGPLQQTFDLPVWVTRAQTTIELHPI